jgi:5-methylcytosine-specific restriction endonuclease McrA
MPIDYKKYPSNWKTEIVPKVKARDNNSCAFCGIKNYSVGYRIGSQFIPTAGNEMHDKAGNGEISYKEARELVKHCNECAEDNLIVIVLTVAHLDHDINNNDLSNLKALCQKCHLDYDKDHHKKNSRETLKKKKGIIELQFS